MKLCGFFFQYKLLIISKYIYNSQQKFWCYIFKCLREPQFSVVIYTSTNPHTRYATSSVNKQIEYILVTHVVMQFTWNGPFSCGVHTKYVCRCARSYRHTAANTARILLACVCMCYSYMKKNACISLSASLGRRWQNREWRQIHTRMFESGYCTPCHASVKRTVAGCWFCSH